MKTWRYVEEYIEIIAGIRDPNTNKVGVSFLSTSPLNLARYDVSFVESIGQQVENKIGLTDRQADLALKIIEKYERQLSKLGVDIAPIRDPQFRTTIRQIDRSRRLWTDGETLFLKFPYVESQVHAVKEALKESQGRIHWDSEARIWRMTMTEYNVSWACGFAQTNQFEIDPKVQELMDLILECEKTPYSIKLTIDNDDVVIANAAPELLRYIEEHVGEVSAENINKLIDYSDILGYEVDSIFEEAVIASTSPRVYNFMCNRDMKLGQNNNEEVFVDIIKYAEAANRLPVYIFEPNLTEALLAVARKHYGDAVISVEGNVKNWDKINLDKHKVIHFTKYNSTWDHKIPLLVSSNGMLYGGDKQMLLSRAEKIVYLAHEVYNNGIRGSKKVAG